MVQIGPTSAAVLARLLAVADEDSPDLHAALEAFTSAACQAVPSFVGVTLSLDGDHPTARITWTVDGDHDGRPLPPAQASLAFALGSQEPGADDINGVDGVDGQQSHWVLYAARPGAFVDLSADLAWLLGLPLGALAVDAHLDGPPEELVAGDPLRTLSLANQALGVLLARGLTPEEARTRLDELASERDGDLASAARHVLDTLPLRPSDGQA